MRNWPVVVTILVVVLLAAVGYFSYLGAKFILDSRKWTDINKKYTEHNFQDPESVRSMIAEIREYQKHDDNSYLDAILFDSLLYDAWYYPDESRDKLIEAVEIGQKLYQEGYYREYIGGQLVFAFLYCGLPTEGAKWQSDVIAEAPYERYRMRRYLVWAMLSLDDHDAAIRAIEAELGFRHLTDEAQAFALTAYTMLGDYAKASEYSEATAQLDDLSANMRSSYADYLLNQGEYEEAARQAIQSHNDSGMPNEGAYFVAKVLAAKNGGIDGEVSGYILDAESSTQNDLSVPALEAAIASELYILEANPVWLNHLLSVYQEYPDDLYILLTVANTCLSEDAGEIDLPDDHVSMLPEPSPLIEKVLAESHSPYSLQYANMLMALNKVVVPDDKPLSEQDLEDSVRYLRQALGDPGTPNPVIAERPPYYEDLLMEKAIVKARAEYPEYDQAIHRAVVDFLNRQIDVYKDVISLKPIEYDQQW